MHVEVLNIIVNVRWKATRTGVVSPRRRHIQPSSWSAFAIHVLCYDKDQGDTKAVNTYEPATSCSSEFKMDIFSNNSSSNSSCGPLGEELFTGTKDTVVQLVIALALGVSSFFGFCVRQTSKTNIWK